MTLTDDRAALLRDKYVLWERASREGPMDLRDYNRRCAEALKAALAIASSAPESSASPWRDMASAPRDGSYILAMVGDASGQFEHLNGRCFVIRHEGKTPSDFDLGWSLHPGFGGCDDGWFTGWSPLPQAEARSVEAPREKFSGEEIRELNAIVGSPSCHADRDGDCHHWSCPQLRDGEPAATGRHCPYDSHEDDEGDHGE